MPVKQVTHNLTITQTDIDYLTNLLLEKETPMTSAELALALIEKRLQEQSKKVEERYKGAEVYNPSKSYDVGQKLIFSQFNYTTAEVTQKRPGNNGEYGDFSVITVNFDEDEFNLPNKKREFAAELTVPHELSSDEAADNSPLNAVHEDTAEAVLEAGYDEIIEKLEEQLQANEMLVRMVGKWFVEELMLEVDLGQLHLAEAVLDMNGGGPLRTDEIIEQIGGLGDAPETLQVFSLNSAMNNDSRFDEVGPAGEVLWYLKRMEPEAVQSTPPMLAYTLIPYDENMLTPEMRELEQEIADEHSDVNTPYGIEEATISLIYPHRRTGTFPLNAKTNQIFPSARTPRIYITLVDAQDGEETPGWVVHKDNYVYGLEPLYAKHRLPVGALVTVRKGDRPGQIVVDFESHRPRTEWIRLVVPKGDQVDFENDRRSIGAGYDDLLILGVDDLPGVDQLFVTTQESKKNIVAILKSIIPSLGRLTPQGTVHAKTIYSAVNVLRRCPPGPILAVLQANPDFENVGGHYWKLS